MERNKKLSEKKKVFFGLHAFNFYSISESAHDKCLFCRHIFNIELISTPKNTIFQNKTKQKRTKKQEDEQWKGNELKSEQLHEIE